MILKVKYIVRALFAENRLWHIIVSTKLQLESLT